MNRDPDYSGITRYWTPGEDARCEILERAKAMARRAVRREDVDAVLDAMWETVLCNRRTVIVGIGAFEWRPWRRRIPTGRKVSTWRLVFKPSQHLKRNKKNGGMKWK